MMTKNSKLKIKCYFNHFTDNVNCQKSKTTPTHGMKIYRGSEGTNPLILNLGTK